MGSRLGRRVIHFANLPIKLLMPTSFNNIKEIALKTIPSASKIEIKRVLESLYGFDVEEVRTLNMEGKKKKRGGLLIAKPDYKKAYVTLKHPLSLSQDLYPIRIIEEDRNALNKQSKSSIVEEGETKSHWLDGNKPGKQLDGKGYRGYKSEKHSSYGKGANRYKTESQSSYRGGRNNRDERPTETVKFPWSSMHSSK